MRSHISCVQSDMVVATVQPPWRYLATHADFCLWHMQGTTEYDNLIGWTELKPVPGLHRLPLELQGEQTAQLSFDLTMSRPSQETFSAGPATASTGVSGGHPAG